MRKLIFALIALIFPACTSPTYSGFCILPEGIPYPYKGKTMTFYQNGLVGFKVNEKLDVMLHSSRCSFVLDQEAE